MQYSLRPIVLGALALLLGGVLAACDANETNGAGPPDTSPAGEMVEGLWEYTGLTTSEGEDLPLTGVFLFKDGIFVQQSIFDGQPFEEQGAMAHSGPYVPAENTVHLVAAPTISVAPQSSSPLTFRSRTEHDLDVSRSGDELTLVFGSGTVQEFEYIGPGEGEIHALEDGVLAFADDYFILVQGNESGVVTGYGTWEQVGESLTLDVIRWSESDGSTATNYRDIVIEATFDGESLTLEDGRTFPVMQ